jgi:predicted RNA-binding Zn-ribbon protein involved in translation (DUF1610 family)
MGAAGEKTHEKEAVMNLEDYIKDLDPELQERARACGSAEELLALAKEAKVPLSDEALATIAGGEEIASGTCIKKKCPKCGCTRLGYQEEKTSRYIRTHYSCSACGYEWDEYLIDDP